MSEEKHYLEVGSDDVPKRARPELLPPADDAKKKPASQAVGGAGSLPVAPETKRDENATAPAHPENLKHGYDETRAFVGIDYKGDRNESEWRSVGERLGGLIWRILIFVAIIGWFIYQAVTCDRFPIYIINR